MHQIPDSAKPVIGETKIIALEIINDMLLKKFGFSIFESFIKEQAPVKRGKTPAQQLQRGKSSNANYTSADNAEDINSYGEPNYSLYTP